MIISHVKIIAFQTIIIHCLRIFYIARKDCSLYNKQNNTCVLGNTRFISRVKRKSGISAHPCIILYLNAIVTSIHSYIRKDYNGIELASRIHGTN